MPDLPPPASDFGSALDSPGADSNSVWPSTSAPGGRTSTFAVSRFDPLAEERARADAHAAAAFDVCHPGLALRAVMLVQGVLLAATLVAAPDPGAWPAMAASAAFAGLTGALGWLVTVCALRPVLRVAGAAARTSLALALGALAACLGSVPLWALGLMAPPTLLKGLGLALAGCGMAALLWAWLDLRARIWQPVDARVRLAELQSRIRPHFLFNALNTALALVRVDPARAEGVLEDLAQLFRVALTDAGVSVSLDEEIELARRYLAIEQVRFGRRLRVHWDIDPAVGAARVPPLMLQPLVENAVRHGVEPSADGADVWVQARVTGGQAAIEVRNTVPSAGSQGGHGMALHNVRERLRLLHDVSAQLDCRFDGKVYRARIMLPL